jgi:2',3'-cyclic-nucleotide 2'-phosphodiesterase (5'-nucleotidase family)
VINNVRQSSKNAVLLLDAGSTFFGQEVAVQSEGRVIVGAMNALGYDAMTVGQMDLYAGVEVLLQRAREASFAILSCNLVGLKDGKPLFAPYTIVERDGVRFGILGVSEPDLGDLPGVLAAAQVLGPRESVQRYLVEVRSKSDVVILLSHLGLESDVMLAQTTPGIDLIVGGKSRQLLTEPEIVGHTVIVQAGYDGEWLGRLDVASDVAGQVVNPRVEIVSLGPEIADDPALAAVVAAYR